MVPDRICMIIPPSGFLLDERVFMTLGILKVAAVLERAGSIVEVLDLSGITNFREVVQDHAQDSDSVLFALTATTPQMPAAVDVASVLRAVRPEARIILGGPHITLVNAAYKREKKLGPEGRATKALQELEEVFDILVAGDGEAAIFEACGEDPRGLIDADDPKNTALFLSNQQLDELPFPARHLVDVSTYKYEIEGFSALSLIAQLGCPFGCGFCGGRESPMLRRIRMRSKENIVEEMKTMWEAYGRPGFMLYDDELNVNPDMVGLMNLIAETQEDLGAEWRLRGFIKAQLFTDEQAEAMRRAGFRWILTGFESGSPRILKNINKASTREENTRCVEIARRHGLKVKALMSIGHPGETAETLRETREWLLETKPDDFDVTIITCYPGSPYYDEAIPHGDGVWVYTYKRTGDRLFQIEVDYNTTADYYKGDPEGGYRAYVFTDELSPEDLIRERDKMEREVRRSLGIPFNSARGAVRYEHSMGQGGHIPPSILRISK